MNKPASHYLQEAYQLGLELENYPVDFPQMPEAAVEVLTVVETAALYARQCYEPFCARRPREVTAWPVSDTTGKVEVTGHGWLKIRVNTLLSNSRRPATGYLESTLLRLLKTHRERAGFLPWYTRAFVAVTEHSRRENGNVFDPDNKDWKSVTNALKGAVFADDDQFTISLILDAVWDDEAFCEIVVLPYSDVAIYFEKRE